MLQTLRCFVHMNEFRELLRKTNDPRRAQYQAFVDWYHRKWCEDQKAYPWSRPTMGDWEFMFTHWINTNKRETEN